MASNFKKNLHEELGRRAYLSMAGKAVIGVVGGTIVMLLTWLRTCHKRDDIQLETPNVSWFDSRVLTLATTLDSSKRVAYFSGLGININDADSVAGFMASRDAGGSLVYELDNRKIDSINKKYDLNIPALTNVNQLIFYVYSFDHPDYVVFLKDSLIKDIISIPE